MVIEFFGQLTAGSVWEEIVHNEQLDFLARQDSACGGKRIGFPYLHSHTNRRSSYERTNARVVLHHEQKPASVRHPHRAIVAFSGETVDRPARVRPVSHLFPPILAFFGISGANWAALQSFRIVGVVRRGSVFPSPFDGGRAAWHRLAVRAVRKWWPWLRLGLRRLADWFPWTPLGLATGVGAGLALQEYAFGQMDIVVLALGYGALGLIALSTVFVILGVMLTKWQLRSWTADESLALQTRVAAPTGFVLRSLRWLPLVHVRWSWEAPASFKARAVLRGGRKHETVVPLERGEYDSIRRRIVVEGAFGLVRLALRMQEPRALEVLPGVGGMGRMPVLMSMAGGEDLPHPMGVAGGDRIEMRRYAPGDPARFIHWKAYSRTRKLMVRMPERALSRSNRTVAYLVAGPGDDASAGAARIAVVSKAFGQDWLFGADGAAPTTRIGEALYAIMRSAAHRDAGAQQLASFLRDAERSGPASVVIFCPPQPGPWLEPVARAIASRSGRAKVVIGVDGLKSMRARTWWQRMISRDAPDASSPLEPLEQVLRTLARHRVEILVVDRQSGRTLSERHRAAALGRAA